MARVVAVVPDLLFGSNVVGMLTAAGHDVSLVPAISGHVIAGADAVVIDLTADAGERIAAVAAVGGDGPLPKSLAFYSHVDADVRTAAEAAGIDVVIPRSRMAREGAAVLDRLLGGSE